VIPAAPIWGAFVTGTAEAAFIIAPIAETIG
jgi:hypothetical protein